jgi:hypothetical protein
MLNGNVKKTKIYVSIYVENSWKSFAVVENLNNEMKN